jgi:hypothetical protein
MLKLTIKASIVLFLFTVIAFEGMGQNPRIRPRNNIHLTLFGDATVGSLNYERIFQNNRKFFLAGGFGVGYSNSLGLPSKSASLLAIPCHLTGNLGEKLHYLEFGFGGATFFYFNDGMEYWDFCIYPMIGYRLQPLRSDRFCARIFAGYPITDEIDRDNYWFFPVGLSLGFTFKKGHH